MQIRCCIGYGPQENENSEIKEEFWKYLDEDVYQASVTGSGFILQFDGNLWAGSKIIQEILVPRTKMVDYFRVF